MSQQQLTRVQVQKSTLMSKILRHHPEEIGIDRDEFLEAHGWISVEKLVSGIRDIEYPDFTLSELRTIVRLCPKQRFALSEDGTMIRANQGHTLPVDLQLQSSTPPDVLYHGTATRFLRSINAQGIRQTRQGVHLSTDIDTARSVGSRHGSPAILEVDAKRMHEEGCIFRVSENGVWLTEHVAPKYFKRIA